MHSSHYIYQLLVFIFDTVNHNTYFAFLCSHHRNSWKMRFISPGNTRNWKKILNSFFQSPYLHYTFFVLGRKFFIQSYIPELTVKSHHITYEFTRCKRKFYYNCFFSQTSCLLNSLLAFYLGQLLSLKL